MLDDNDKPPSDKSTDTPKADKPASNLWSFLTAFVALGALVFLTWYLARHYDSSNDAATILGIVVPVIGAAFGVTLGYWTGSTTGQAQGESSAKKEVKAKLLPQLDDLRHVSEFVTKIEEGGASPAGAEYFRFDADSLRERETRVEFPVEDLSRAREAVAQVRATVEAL